MALTVRVLGAGLDVGRSCMMIMFATPGNLSTGVSLDILLVWCGDARNVVFVPGYCFANTLAARLQAEGDSGESMNIRCTLLNMSFSAHADARGITRTVRRLNPRSIMLVHGNEAKIKEFQPLLREALGVLCAAKDETSVEFMGRRFCCNFLRKS
jgi:integrator complex subunit 11